VYWTKDGATVYSFLGTPVIPLDAADKGTMCTVGGAGAADDKDLYDYDTFSYGGSQCYQKNGTKWTPAATTGGATSGMTMAVYTTCDGHYHYD
jgi:hypothetical protein